MKQPYGTSVLLKALPIYKSLRLAKDLYKRLGFIEIEDLPKPLKTGKGNRKD